MAVTASEKRRLVIRMGLRGSDKVFWDTDIQRCITYWGNLIQVALKYNIANLFFLKANIHNAIC